MATAADPLPSEDRPAVLFVCTHNSARSQLAEGLLRQRHGDRWRAFSAGTVARGVHPLAAEVLREVGVDPSPQSSKTIDSLGETAFDVVVTVCDNAREACPYLPARDRNLHHAFRDPSAVEGTDAERLEAFRAVRSEITDWLDATFGDGIAVREATPDDALALIVLLEDAGLPTSDLNEVDGFLVALEADTVVGGVGVEAYGADGLLRSLVVAPGVRGRGVGGRLAAAAERFARDRGLRTLTLLTTTAAPFFEAHGYTPFDRVDAPEGVRQSSEFRDVCPASAACLGKSMSPT